MFTMPGSICRPSHRRCSVRGRAIPGQVTTDVHAQAALPAGSLAMTASLRGTPTAPAVSADLDAHFERGKSRVEYRAGLTGERLGSLVRLVTGAAPSTASVSVTASGLRLSARGALSGLLSAGPSPPALEKVLPPKPMPGVAKADTSSEAGAPEAPTKSKAPGALARSGRENP
jgi:hypothetical protein